MWTFIEIFIFVLQTCRTGVCVPTSVSVRYSNETYVLMFEPTFSQFFPTIVDRKVKRSIAFERDAKTTVYRRKIQNTRSQHFYFTIIAYVLRRDDTRNTISAFDKYVTRLDI